MLEVTEVAPLRAHLVQARQGGKRIGFVPTMGALHEGHLSLVDESRQRADLTVMSIFVNPLQFGPREDFSRYPRPLERDRELARARGVDLLFLPRADAMYPAGADTRVTPGPAADRWEGAVRPGHFTGVLTVVAKLFNLVQPDVAVFGQKDIQQATLIRHMVRDLDWPVEVVVAPIVRDERGLALSSRNTYLAAEDQPGALSLSEGLRTAARSFARGERSAERLAALVRERMEVHPRLSVDYIAVVDPLQLAPVPVAEPGTILAVAARVGQTRLLDNVILGEEPA